MNPRRPLQAPLRLGVLQLQRMKKKALVICIDNRVCVEQELGESHRADIRRKLAPPGGEVDRDILQSPVCRSEASGGQRELRLQRLVDVRDGSSDGKTFRRVGIVADLRECPVDRQPGMAGRAFDRHLQLA